MTTIHLHDYVEQVDKLIDDNRLVEAIEHCRHILHSYPRHIDTYRVMGKALLEKQDFDAASDLFLRILSADPNDFISHVGLSIVYKEESQLDQALWHLERAHEIQPYNVAIQGELRKLYNTQTEVRAGIIPLSRGALARLYMQGELYQQAISELRRILIDEPERVDLQVLLAEALWRDDQRIDAEEVCLTVLQELPNCVVANAILAEIWLQTGRIPEAQKYLHRLHRLTQQTQKTLDKETIAGQAFTTEGAFPLPEEASLEFLQTGMVEPSKPQAPTDDWVKEVKFDEPAGDESLDQVVLEPESGMHSYDWLSDIGDAEGDGAEKATGETDWFSQEKAKDELKISTSELNAEWLADLRGEEEESGFQPLDLGDTTNQLVTDEQPSETDWFADDGEGAGETAVAEEFDFAETAVSPTEQSPSEETEEDELNWLDALADEETSLQIDATNLMDNDMATWADSEPHVVEEPKTPYWLSSMTKDELEAIELDPDEAMDWLDDIPDEADVEEATADSEPGEEVDLVDLMETAVAPQDLPTDDDLASVALDTGDLGEADDWLSALTEGEIDEELAWETGEADSEAIDPIDQIQLDASTEELAALSDADDWLESAAADLDAILHTDEIEEDEFPNLALPEIEGREIEEIPDWLGEENSDFSEELEAAVSSENDPQETPLPEEPKEQPAPKTAEDEADELDWLDEFADEAAGSDEALPEPPIETEGMPSWLEMANKGTPVEVVDEWDSQSAEIPDWLNEPVDLADLDEADSLLDVPEEMDSGSLTGLLAEIDDAEPEQAEEEPEEMGLTGLLSNLTLDKDEEPEETAVADDDFLAELLYDATDESELDDFFADEEPAGDAEAAIDLTDLDEEVSLTALLSGANAPDEAEAGLSLDEDEDDWMSDLADLVETVEAEGQEPEPETEEEAEGLTGMLANLWSDEADELAETAVSDNFLEDLEEPDAGDDLGLTELLAGIDYAEDAIDSEPNLPDFDIEPVEPSLTETLLEITQEPEEEAPPTAEDTTWLTQLEADTGALQDENEDLDMAEETGLDWLTAPIEPEPEPEEAAPPQPVEELPEEAELDGTVEDWDDAMSWLEELAAQQEDPVAELPSVAETMLDEALDEDTAVAEPPAEDDEIGIDWLSEITDSEMADFVDEEIEEAEPAMPSFDLAEDAADFDNLIDDEELSWLDELATGNLVDSRLTETEPTTEPEELEPEPMTEWAEEAPDDEESEASDDSWLDELMLAEEEEPEFDEAQPDLAEFAVEPVEMNELADLADLDMSAESDLDWLDAALEEPDMAEEQVEAPMDEVEAPEQAPPVEETQEQDDEEYIVTGVTDALKEHDGIEEAEADLEEALAWLDELDDEGELALTDEAPPTRVNAAIDEPDFADEPETIVIAPEPDELSLALDRLEQQVRSEGVTVPDTAVSPLTLSTDELNDALDWIEQQSEAPAVEEEWADEFADQPEEPQPETAVATQQTADDDMDLTAMSEDPEAWLEQLLGDDLDMDIEMEPPPIKPSEDAVFVTDEAATDEIEPDFEAVKEEAATVDSLLDDVTLDEMPDDPDAAVAWLDQMVEDDAPATLETEEVGEFDLAAEHLDEMTLSDEDDPEAWLEQMLSGDLALDVDMEPPPIKPSEDAVFVTDDAPEAPSEPEPVAEPVDEMEVPETAVSEAETEEETPDLDFGDFEDDPEAWLEQMLSDDLDMAVEMEPPPIKPSEDAMFVTDDGRSHQEPEPASPLAEETDSEADIIADVPDDPDEAMVWLEQLAARQGAAIEELPSVTDADTEPEMPDWMAEELQEQAAEGVEELPISEVHDADIDAELPDWLGAESDDQVVGETDWLRALPEADMDTWLSAEEEATIAGAVEEVVLPDTGPLSPLPQTPPADETMIEDDLFEPVLEPSTGAYSVDEAKLELAQRALGDGRMNDAIVQFKELVAAGTGMMTIIAELEQAAVAHTQTPALSQVLGDAYMRNGQLQKALASYRAALDQL